MIYLTHGLIYSSPALNVQGLPFQIELFVQQVPSFSSGSKHPCTAKGLAALEVVVAGMAPGGPVSLPTV